jgi:hypothetical protein
MKRISAIVLVFAFLPFAGCNRTSNEGGGEGKDTFTVTPPRVAPTVRQGETQKETLTLNRGADFKKDVTFSPQTLPEGVKVEFEPPTVKAGDKAETEMIIKAAKDAPEGDAKIKVTAKPATGKETVVEVAIHITK